jgi:MOSC domain-containing protein YiiM
MPRLLSVNVGLPRDVTWNGKTVRTSVWKSPVSGRRMVRKLDIDGDAQADLAGHGGEQRAVFVYQMDSYHYWQSFLDRSDFTFGQFGENFTVEGLLDSEVCVGDRYRIGDAIFEVTQPRVTCYRVGIRMNEPRMPALLVAHHRPGFYFRVLQEGEVGAGDDIVKITDGPERMSVADVDALLYLPGPSREQLQRALRIPALSKGWQGSFRAMLQQDLGSKTSGGNPGLATEWMRQKRPRLLVIWGKHDLSFDLGEPERYRKDVPNAEVHVLDAGHFALDTAADEIAELVRGFVASSRSGFLARQAG